ncbi:MAG: DUF3780 domain-containing protein [Ktedonobacterales bacterium]|nr:DUF3780 domain-containing protein [Ktedonobacterales bacterium]
MGYIDFIIGIPKKQGDVTITECLNGDASVSATIARAHWDIIANQLQADFNQRLKSRD